MSALVGLMGNQAQAGSITLSVDLNGVVIYSTTSSAPDQSVSASLVAVNSALGAHGSAYRFTSLSANSNYTGGSNGSLQTNGQINMSGAGTTAAVLSVDTTQSGFLSPTGSGGMMVSSAGGDYLNVPAGTTTYRSDYQSTTFSPLLSFAASGGSTSFSGATPSQSIGTIPSGYSLSNHFLISLTKSGGSEGFTGSVLVTAAVPEPASVVMLLTGMPLPLAIVFGLIRRRRAEA
jgi:hypothetical protein